MGIEHALLIDAYGTVHILPAMKPRLHFEDKNVAVAP
jgi:hypothetical protein